MKILVILPSLKKMGPINVALSTIKRLFDKGVSVSVAALDSGDLFEDFEHYSESLVLFQDSNRLVKLLKIRNFAMNFDIVHSHCLLPDIIGMTLSSKKTVSTLHCFLDIDYINLKGKIFGTLLTFVHLFVLRRIDKVVSCSGSVSDYTSDKYNLSSYVIRNGVDESKYAKEELSVGKKLILVSVGVLNKRKNVIETLEAFSSLDDKNMELWVVGDGPDYARLVDSYIKDNIKFLGRIDNVRAVLNKSDVYVSSSLGEGLPMAMLEAMSEGLTYIVSDIPPHNEINKMSPGAGIVYEGSEKGLANEISRLSRLTISDYKRSSINSYTDNFTNEKMASEYLSFYQKHI
ncbi:putative Glycos_transf_1 domain-containing protein [Vibrio chagasii]|nr:putative Glycos_transf_1 domain-containing protein [Vibrio chagasii]CAH6942368.1 putative Glycos_transf_1 domain-containing protein [Vibrio chagasii]CAH6945042.1 putative Glycos_transf_1 domain-containing protein [Vibrio chagasii]